MDFPLLIVAITLTSKIPFFASLYESKISFPLSFLVINSGIFFSFTSSIISSSSLLISESFFASSNCNSNLFFSLYKFNAYFKSSKSIFLPLKITLTLSSSHELSISSINPFQFDNSPSKACNL